MRSATNSTLMRQKNEKIILSLINEEPISRAEISKRTGLTKAAVTIIVDDLKKRNIVTEKNVRVSSVGRNPVMLYLNGDCVYTIGINITRFDISVGITDLCGRVITEDVIEIKSPDRAFADIKKVIEKQMSENGIEPSKIHKTGVVTPGPIDVENGRILNPPNFEKWHNVSVVDELKKIIGFDVIYENVSSATAICEKYFGAAKESKSFLALLVDEGVGSGIVIDNVLFKGPCEFGHIPIKLDGKKCGCGNRGCLEKYASVPEILAGTQYKSWAEAVDANDGILKQEAEYLSSAIITANNIFSLESVVLCGELSYKPEKLIEYISERISGCMLANSDFKVRAGMVESEVLVASAIAIHDFFA